VLDKTGRLPVSFPVQIIYRIVSYRVSSLCLTLCRAVCLSSVCVLSLRMFLCLMSLFLCLSVCVVLWASLPE